MGGPTIIDNYINTMERYDENDPIKTNTMAKQSSGSFLAYLYLENSGHEKNGSII